MFSEILEDDSQCETDCGWYGDCVATTLGANESLVTTHNCVCWEGFSNDGPQDQGGRGCYMPASILDGFWKVQTVLSGTLICMILAAQVQYVFNAAKPTSKKTVIIVLRNVFVLMMPQWIFLIMGTRQQVSKDRVYVAKDTTQTMLMMNAFMLAVISCLLAVKKSVAYHKKRNRHIAASVKKSARRRSSSIGKLLHSSFVQQYHEQLILFGTVLVAWAPIIPLEAGATGLEIIHTILFCVFLMVVNVVVVFHATTEGILRDYKEVQKMNDSAGSSINDEMLLAVKRGIRRVKATYRSIVWFCAFAMVLLVVITPAKGLKLGVESIICIIALPLMTLSQAVIFLSRVLTKKKKRARVGSTFASSVTSSGLSSRGSISHR